MTRAGCARPRRRPARLAAPWRRVVAACALAAVCALAAACATQPPAPAPEPEPGIVHVVLVWLRDPADRNARERLTQASLAFAGIDGVMDVRVGGPVPSERPIVDDSFDLAIVVSLRDRHALDAYLAHPEHARAGREVLAPAAARVLVYDVEVGDAARPAVAGLPEAP